VERGAEVRFSHAEALRAQRLESLCCIVEGTMQHEGASEAKAGVLARDLVKGEAGRPLAQT